LRFRKICLVFLDWAR